MNEFDFSALTDSGIEVLAAEYQERGFVVLGNAEKITALFPDVLAKTTGLAIEEIERMLDPASQGILAPHLRERLSKVPTTPDLAQSLLSLLSPVLLKLLGPIVHVSSNFHAQFKGGGIGQIGYSGFHSTTEYVEIHGPHLLHQDFAAASLPISPSMITLWVGLNTTPSWKLRLYPGSHRSGVLCDQFLEVSNQKLKMLEDGIDIPAHRGKAVLFNGMMLHGTGEQGPQRRASCDIRFFPLCGFLPSEPHVIHPDPLSFLKDRVKVERSATLLAPLFQDLVFLGQTFFTEQQLAIRDGEAHSPILWIRYLIYLLKKEQQTGIPYLRALVNTGMLENDDVLVRKFKDHAIYSETLRTIRNKIAESNAFAADLRHLDQLIVTLENK